LRYAAQDCTQIVILAAGMDARAWRIDWPNHVQLFEVDRPAVFAYKEPILRTLGLRARCARHVVGADLAEDWRPLLLAQGFDPWVPTTWLAEGLFVYLFEPQVKAILADLTALSAPSSRLAVDLADVSLLAWPPMLPYFERLKTDGSPWTFGTAEPESLLEETGWRARALVVGEPGTTYDRWPYPPAPRQVPGVPRSYFVTSIRPMACGPATASGT
jgi:methyltransferase (TIGR00027 family)